MALAFESHPSTVNAATPRSENRFAKAFEESLRASGELTRDPFALDPSKHPRDRLLQHRHVLREQNESEREHPQPKHRQNAENAPDDQQDSNGNANPSGRWLAQPSNEFWQPAAIAWFQTRPNAGQVRLCDRRSMYRSSCPGDVDRRRRRKASACRVRLGEPDGGCPQDPRPHLAPTSPHPIG